MNDCTECGIPLGAEKVCPKCGKEVEEIKRIPASGQHYEPCITKAYPDTRMRDALKHAGFKTQ